MLIFHFISDELGQAREAKEVAVQKAEHLQNLYDGLKVNIDQYQARIQSLTSNGRAGLVEKLNKKLTIARNDIKRLRELNDSKSGKFHF